MSSTTDAKSAQTPADTPLAEQMTKLEAIAYYFLWGIGKPMEYSQLCSGIYLADREAFLGLGQTISGQVWVKRDWGIDIDGLRTALHNLYNRGLIDVE